MSSRNDVRALHLINGVALSALVACAESPTLPEARLLAEDVHISDVAGDDEHAYWLASPGRLMRVPLAGGTAEVVVDDGDYLNYLVLGEQTVYWGDLGNDPGFFCGRLLAVDKQDGEVRVMTTGSSGEWCWSGPLLEEDDRLVVFGWGDGAALGAVDPISGETTQVTSLGGAGLRAFEAKTGGYYLLLGDGRIVRMGRYDAVTAGVIDGIRSPRGMVVSATDITWVDDNYVGLPSEIYRRSLSGGLHTLLHSEALRSVGAPVRVDGDVWLPLGASAEGSGDGGLLRIRSDGTVDSYDVDYMPGLLRALGDQLLVLTAPPPDAFNGSVLVQPLP